MQGIEKGVLSTGEESVHVEGAAEELFVLPRVRAAARVRDAKIPVRAAVRARDKRLDEIRASDAKIRARDAEIIARGKRLDEIIASDAETRASDKRHDEIRARNAEIREKRLDEIIARRDEIMALRYATTRYTTMANRLKRRRRSEMNEAKQDVPEPLIGAKQDVPEPLIGAEEVFPEPNYCEEVFSEPLIGVEEDFPDYNYDSAEDVPVLSIGAAEDCKDYNYYSKGYPVTEYSSCKADVRLEEVRLDDSLAPCGEEEHLKLEAQKSKEEDDMEGMETRTTKSKLVKARYEHVTLGGKLWEIDRKIDAVKWKYKDRALQLEEKFRSDISKLSPYELRAPKMLADEFCNRAKRSCDVFKWVALDVLCSELERQAVYENMVGSKESKEAYAEMVQKRSDLEAKLEIANKEIMGRISFHNELLRKQMDVLGLLDAGKIGDETQVQRYVELISGEISGLSSTSNMLNEVGQEISVELRELRALRLENLMTRRKQGSEEEGKKYGGIGRLQELETQLKAGLDILRETVQTKYIFYLSENIELIERLSQSLSELNEKQTESRKEKLYQVLCDSREKLEVKEEDELKEFEEERVEIVEEMRILTEEILLYESEIKQEAERRERTVGNKVKGFLQSGYDKVRSIKDRIRKAEKREEVVDVDLEVAEICGEFTNIDLDELLTGYEIVDDKEVGRKEEGPVEVESKGTGEGSGCENCEGACSSVMEECEVKRVGEEEEIEAGMRR